VSRNFEIYQNHLKFLDNQTVGSCGFFNYGVDQIKEVKMEAIWKSFLLVAATEMGDKTQLLAFVLATRFRNPIAVLSGIFVATIFNHLLASYFGSWVSEQVPPHIMKWVLGATFIAFAAWILIPDKDDDKEKDHKYGAFVTTLITFFLAEMGDKTQLSTVALAAHYDSVVRVTMGTTIGMMFSDGLAVIFGEKINQMIPMKWIRIFSAVLFVIFGLGIILGF
jgi:putative Ca2+/H+ antiporter (TMEM165/GDT1 family)